VGSEIPAVIVPIRPWVRLLGSLTAGTITTFTGCMSAIVIGLLDAWVFNSALVHGVGGITDLTLVLIGIAALLGHNPQVPVVAIAA